MAVLIDKFWIEAVLTEVYPRFVKEGGVDLDGSGAIEGKEIFGDLDQDGTVGDRDDYKAYLRKNRSQLSAKIPFFRWGEKLSVGNRLHRLMYLLSDIHSDTQMASAYAFIAGLVDKTDEEIGLNILSPEREARIYYWAMKGAGVVFKNQDDDSLVTNVEKRQLDCDTSGFTAMGMGDERGVELNPVRALGHVFLRGKEGSEEFNIDAGEITTDQRYGVDPDLVSKGIYLKTLDDRGLESLFLETRGLVLARFGRGEEALAAYDKALAIDRDDAIAHNNRGFILEKLGRDEEALAAYDKALAIDPNYAKAHNNRGVVLERLGRDEEALAAFDKALAINPNDAKAHNNRSFVLEGLGRDREALAALQKACQLDPTLLDWRTRILLSKLHFFSYWEL